MDIALMAMKKMRREGHLDDLEVSDEINACSIMVDVDVDGKNEEWLVMFKNETHNHPTEIEPFGGAATCLGGAIRDPLSGRSYVYQAMRVTGAADPRLPISQTMEGKLPQRKIVTKSAHGYSSYGNQIGLATGLVREIYHPNYVAKRMEIGAVIAAAPKKNVFVKPLIQAIILYYLVAAQDVMVVAVRQAHLRSIQQNQSTHVVQKCKKVIRQPNEKYSDYLEMKP